MNSILKIFTALWTFSITFASPWLTPLDEAILNDLVSSPNFTDPGFICDQIRGLQEKHKQLCYRSPAILSAIGEANKRTLEHLEKVFEEDQLPASLLVYKSIFSFRIADESRWFKKRGF